MRYWAYLAAKLTIVSLCMYGLLRAVDSFWPAEPPFYDYYPPRFAYNLQFTLAVGLWFILTCGAVALCIWDQRHRCRVCLRRLRMPVETGSWGRMLQLGRPRIEYICPYGHGTLKEPEVQITGHENPEWTRHAELWEELCGQSKSKESDR